MPTTIDPTGGPTDGPTGAPTGRSNDEESQTGPTKRPNYLTSEVPK